MIVTILFKTALTMLLMLATVRVIFSFFQLKEHEVPSWVYVVIGFGAVITFMLFVVSGILYLWY
jgi:hypothetical protein